MQRSCGSRFRIWRPRRANWSDTVSETEHALTTRVTNLGTVAAGEFHVVWRLGTADGDEIARVSVEGLAGDGTTYEATAYWDASTVELGSDSVIIHAEVDPGESVRDFDRNDNIGAFGISISAATGGPVVVAQPSNGIVSAGDAFNLTTETSSDNALSYQWRKDGEDIPNATSATLEMPNTQRFHAGIYSVVANYESYSVESTGTEVTVADQVNSDSRLLNLSTRALASTGGDVLIPGFVIQGPDNKQMLIRAVGPKLQTLESQIPWLTRG